jgi:hypothetical protein
MIPNLNDLPPSDVKEESRLKPLLLRFAAFVMVLSIFAGTVWFYTRGVHQLALSEMNSTLSLEDTSAKLWQLGTAPEVRFMDPDLTWEIERLRLSVTASPEIMVLPAEAGSAVHSTHEIRFMRGNTTIITIQAFFNDVDLLSFRTAPEFAPERIR